ncbi:MarR family winged helix-turn-helix transcriptional regulator [Albimonas pacifica]|uniref:DNA-binding transcriptional regulator, MarR family n=1 Tax=Albimonas pacifica TaxID=1114924 RepID=A0A1I3F4X4_9RHOB|nr:MarR family transcriptional regulator [Albimonas pacifica]SFI06295.1 DNA-binding transcriptional regulator, MarR family [Albimonas pacifica]
MTRAGADPGPSAPRETRPTDMMLCFALYSASHAMHRVYRPWLDRMGLTYPQFLAMTALWARDGRLVGELCAELRLATSTLTPVLKRLEATGLIARSRDRGDARAVRVTLTDEGRALRARTEGLQEALVEATGLPVERLVALNAEVSALRERLSAWAERQEAEAAA